MRRDTIIQLLAAAVLIACLGASAALTPTIAASAGRNRLEYTTAAEEGTPPDVALGIAMGAFRGLFVNYLWIRANQLKDEGKYHEAVDLADTITKLQPRFPRVWVFHAWNLAYNISVTTKTPQERWSWVQAGIRLLRDEGIPANPNDVLLHKELAWIFLQKVQGIMDDANGYYKRAFAEEWTILVGTPAQGLLSDDSISKRVAQLEKIQDAADTLDELYNNQPGASELVSNIRAAGLDLDMGLLRIFEMVRQLGRVKTELGTQYGVNNLPKALVDSINDPKTAPVWDALVAHIRKRLITDKYHMELDRMIRYTKEYGPLDWRHPAAHALYWSHRGVEQALLRTNKENIRDFDFLNTDRISMHAVQELFRTGTLYFNILNPANSYMTLPNTAYIDKYAQIMHEVSQRNVVYDPKGGAHNRNDTAYNMYSAGYENFLADAVRVLYRRGDKDAARKLLDKLATYSKQNFNDPNRYLKYRKTLEEFVYDEVVKDDRFTSPSVALQEVSQSLLGAFISALDGNSQKYRDQMDYARNFHHLYTTKQVFGTGVNISIKKRLEIMDKHFGVFAGKTLALVVMSFGMPDGPMLYHRVPLDLQQYGYYFLEQMPQFKQLQAQKTADGSMTRAEKYFPKPEGMDAASVKIKAEVEEDKRAGQAELK